jgi:hypothetical protein
VNLENIRRTNGPIPHVLPKDNKKSVTISRDESSKNSKGTNISCHYGDHNNHNMAHYRAIDKFKRQKTLLFESNRKSLVFLFGVIKDIKGG